MNRLKKQRVYLAGAIDRTEDRGKAWRESITPFLESMSVQVFNPLTKASDIGIETDDVQNIKARLKSNAQYDELSEMMKIIRAVDLRLVDISDFLVVYMDLNIHLCGTLEELFLANRQKKPILVCMAQGKKQAPDWLFGTIPHEMIFDNWDELRGYLAYINTAKTLPDNLKRWCFFNL